MELKQVTPQNLEQEHICCAISASADARKCAAAKKEWMAARFAEGYHFCKLDTNGKVFIEYTPAQNAWAPVEADGWLYIDCLWVSGQFKGHGWAGKLLQTAKDYAAQNAMKGLVALAGLKKMAFLSDPKFLMHHGFVQTDTAPPYYQLLALPLQQGAEMPRFASTVQKPSVSAEGTVIYYTNHCPHTQKYVEILQAAAQERGLSFAAHKLQTTAQAQVAPNPFTTWAMFHKGAFVTNEIFSEAKMQKFWDENNLKQ